MEEFIIINEDFKAGFIFTAIGKFSNIFIQLLINAILSRLLTPKDYGIVAVVQVFVLFFQLLTEAGMGPAIIQNKSLLKKDYSILFNYSIIFAVTLSILFGLFGNVISLVYDDDIYKKICWIQSIAVFIGGANVIPIAILNKEKRFKDLNIVVIKANFFGGITGVISALLGMGVYSLIYSSIAIQFATFCLINSKVNLVFKYSLEIEPLKKIWYFARNQFSFNFINYFSRNADNLLIGKFIGEKALGNYSKAYQLLMMPNSVLLGIITPVLQPVLAEFENDISYIRDIYFKIFHFLALIGVPLSIFLSFTAKEVVFLMYGNQWGDAVYPFSILSLSVWVQMTVSSSGAIFQARNKSNYLLLNGLISAIILVSSIIIGLTCGSIDMVSIFLTIGFYLNFLISFRILTHYVLESSIFSLIKEIKKPLILGFVLVGVFIILKFLLEQISIGVFLTFIIKTGLFLSVSIGGVFLLGETKYFKVILKK